MSGLIAGITAGLANAAIAVVARLFTQKFFEGVISRVSVGLLGRLAEFTTNTVDDGLVADAARRLGVKHKSSG